MSRARLALRYDNAARAPNANRWLIWRRDPAYGGRARTVPPPISTATHAPRRAEDAGAFQDVAR